MKKPIVVRKNRSQRWGIRILTVFFAAAAGITIAWYPFPPEYGSLLFLPVLIPLTWMLCYFETWQIIFSKDQICRRAFLLRARTYPYTQLQDVFSGYSATDHGFVRMKFRDGKALMFRMEDENAEQALQRICSHRSIRHLGHSRTRNGEKR